MKYFPKTTREWLKKSRMERGLSQTQLAEKIGIGNSAVGKYENGARDPSVKVAKAIAFVLNLNWTRFFECYDEEACFLELKGKGAKNAEDKFAGESKIRPI